MIGTPLHGGAPELQVLDPPTAPSILSFETRQADGSRAVKVRAWAAPRRENRGQECVDYSEGDQTQEEEDQSGEAGASRPVLRATHGGSEEESQTLKQIGISGLD